VGRRKKKEGEGDYNGLFIIVDGWMDGRMDGWTDSYKLIAVE
jgi:hypothetical protein